MEENKVCEALDLILTEALECRRNGRLWEIDTTGRSPAAIARDIDRLLRERPASRFGHVHWLSDPRVTAELLPRSA